MDFFMVLFHNQRWRFSCKSPCFSTCILLSFSLYSVISHVHGASNLGINYGRIADNLPTPKEVVGMLQGISVSKTRIYDTDAGVLKAFANSGISIIVGIGDENVGSLTNPSSALSWVETNVAVYYPATDISGIAVGNEVLSGNDTQLMSDLIFAMRNLYSALSSFSLQDKIFISTAHSFSVLQSSYPPSAGTFIPSSYMSQMLQFLQTTSAPFLINAYPYFAYKASPNDVSLQYVLFETTDSATSANAAATITDPSSGLTYDNMLDAQVDAVYSALEAMGYKDMEVIVSETGWPSAGDTNEAGASLQNAQAYSTNLIRRIASGRGPPARQSKPLQAFIFALFNEDKKKGPLSEQHYGLFNPDGTRVYDFGLDTPHAYTLYDAMSSPSYASPRSRCPKMMHVAMLVLLSMFLLLFSHMPRRHNVHQF